ncbi:MAG: ParA family protein [Ruminococcus sp.]|nr:ParA family protein [Ruminococcus sp.]
MSAKIIALTNQKGGVGKTTTVCALCGVFASRGKKVLAIDLDPQGNLSFSLGASMEGVTIHDVITGKNTFDEAIQRTENCDVVASNILLSGSELELNTAGREFILKEKLEPLKERYDYILLDTPPALSILTINAYVATDDLIVPMTPEILSLQGISQLTDTIMAVKKYYNKSLDVRGILFTKYNSRYLLAREVEDMAEIVARQLESVILDTKISHNIQVAEAPAHQKTLIRYAPNSKASRDYIKLADELYGK